MAPIILSNNHAYEEYQKVYHSANNETMRDYINSIDNILKASDTITSHENVTDWAYEYIRFSFKGYLDKYDIDKISYLGWKIRIVGQESDITNGFVVFEYIGRIFPPDT